MKNKKMSKMGHHQQKGRPSKMLTPTEISVIQDLAEQGKSQVKISELTGFSRKTIRFYLSGGIREGGFLERHKEQIFQFETKTRRSALKEQLSSRSNEDFIKRSQNVR